MTAPALHDEALRQQRLLAVLGGSATLADIAPWLRDSPPRAQRGLQAYAAQAGALAERALAAAFPTTAQLVGEAGFAALARAFWRAQPPLSGDVAQWGDALPGFITAAPSLASEPYLADVARLDWAVHQAEQASDTGDAPTGLDLLATADPDRLWLHPAAGTTLVSSGHPVATIWLAHRSTAADRFAPARQALACGVGEHALVWRQGFRAQVGVLPAVAAGFIRAVLAGQPLGQVLSGADPGFAFDAWLVAALQQGWLASVATQAFEPPRLRATPRAPAGAATTA